MGVFGDQEVKDSVQEAYNDVRDDKKTDINWLVLKYDGKNVFLSCTGCDFGQFQSQFGDDERAFGYVRITTGDEMSVRSKFAFIAWVGPNVSALQKAKMSTDKAYVKEVIDNFAKEMLIDDIKDIDEDTIREELKKAGGANYGTGSH